MPEELIQVRNLKKYYPIKAGVFQRTVDWIKAVDNVSFTIKRGETLGLVGESGCGKTTTGKTIIRLVTPTSGEVFFNMTGNGNGSFSNPIDIFKMKRAELKKIRQKIQIIFQDPYGSLNPRMTVNSMMKEIVNYYHLEPTKEKAKDRIVYILEKVGLHPEDINKFPHEFSGGQRQRIGIARALMMKPELIICDEPVSALDVSIQAQVINLLVTLKKDFKLTYLFIAHDLAVVKHISDKVAVMYLGKVVEVASKQALYNDPKHPYTEALLSAVPEPDPDYPKKRIILKGDVPSPLNPPSGCRFHTRCMYAQDVCSEIEPELLDKGNQHYAACHFR